MNPRVQKSSIDAAIRVHREGRLRDAQQLYRRILQREPNHAGALHLYGVIRQQRGRHEEALELIGRAIELKPKVAVYHNNYGAALFSLERFEEAEATFHARWPSARATPMPSRIWGWSRRRIAKEDAALESLQKALHFDPPHRDARKRLAGLLRDLGRSQEAVQVFEQALADRPAAETYADFGSLLLTLGQVKEAAAAYRMAIGLKPDFAAAHFNLAQSLEELHDAASTRQHFFQAAQLQPDRPLWRLRGLTCGPAVFENAQEIEEHSESFENAIHYAPRHGYGTGPVPASLDDIVQVGLFPGFLVVIPRPEPAAAQGTVRRV